MCPGGAGRLSGLRLGTLPFACCSMWPAAVQRGGLAPAQVRHLGSSLTPSLLPTSRYIRDHLTPLLVRTGLAEDAPDSGAGGLEQASKARTGRVDEA